MIIELRDIEAYIEPQDIIYQALREREIELDNIIGICSDEYGVDRVLESFGIDELLEYCSKDKSYSKHIFDLFLESLKSYDREKKAQVLLEVLKILILPNREDRLDDEKL